MTNGKASSPFLQTVSDAIRVKHYSIRTEEDVSQQPPGDLDAVARAQKATTFLAALGG